MRYNISINQPKAIEWGLSLSEAFTFGFCYELPSWADAHEINGKVFYFASRHKVLKELPLLTDKPDTIYRLYKSLDDKGLIKWIKYGHMDLVNITVKGSTWNKFNSEKNPSLLGKKSELSSEIFPTDNNTSIDNKPSSTHAHEDEIEADGFVLVEQAAKKVLKFLEDFPAQKESMIYTTGWNEGVHGSFNEEIVKWLFHSDNQQMLKNPERFVNKFGYWLTRSKNFNNGKAVNHQSKPSSGKLIDADTAKRILERAMQKS